jgi:type I restriction enzyme S subunit
LEFIEMQTCPMNTAITRTEREIVLLREYRTRLIADVVTGKLDVREAARNLPDDVEETDVTPEADAGEIEELELDAAEVA